jgi:nicotinate dehydrogenase subunit A
VTSTFHLVVNGQPREVTTDAADSLLTVLRNHLGLLGTRFGCGLGQCGACFVQIDGAVLPSCVTSMSSLDGSTVVTVEGLGPEGALHRVQEAVLDVQAAQCGYCTSGILVSAAALLERHPQPTEEQVVRALEGNLCRCGVQRRVVRAVLDASLGAS